LQVYKIVNAISALRAMAGGGKDQGIVVSEYSDRANIVPTCANCDFA